MSFWVPPNSESLDTMDTIIIIKNLAEWCESCQITTLIHASFTVVSFKKSDIFNFEKL